MRRALSRYNPTGQADSDRAVNRAMERAKGSMSAFDFGMLAAALNMVYYHKTHTMEQAAAVLGVTYKTLRRLVEGRLFFLVAEEMEYLPKSEKKGERNTGHTV